MSPSVNMDAGVVLVHPGAILAYDGLVAYLTDGEVRIGAERVERFDRELLEPDAGIITHEWRGAAILPASALAVLGSTMKIPHATINEGEPVTFLGRILLDTGGYLTPADVEAVQVHIYDDRTSLRVSTDDLEPSEVISETLVLSGSMRGVPGGHNFAWRLQDPTVHLNGGNVYRVEFVIFLTEERGKITKVYRLTVASMYSQKRNAP